MRIVRLFYNYSHFVYKCILAIFLDKFLSRNSSSSFIVLFTVRFTFISAIGSKRGSGTFHFFDKVLYIYIYINIARKLDNLIGSKQARKTWSLCSTQRGTSYTIDLPVVSSHTRRSKSGKSDVKSRDRSNRPLAPVNRENPCEKIFKNSLPPLYCIIAARLGHKDLYIVFSK